MNVLALIGREQALFDADLARVEAGLAGLVAASRFLVIGGACSIVQALYQQLHEHCLAAAPRYDRSALAGKMLRVLEAVVAARSDKKPRAKKAGKR